MKLDGVLTFAQQLIEKAVSPGDFVVDATLGNGHDTLFLAQLIGPSGMVYGFDIQEKAVFNTKSRLEDQHLTERATLFHIGHEHILDSIPDNHHRKIKAAIFNLGYLPGGDKTIVTTPETTISAIGQLLEIMASDGMIVIVIYHGHQGGANERDALLEYVKQLDQKRHNVLQYQFINQQSHPPFIVAIEKINL